MPSVVTVYLTSNPKTGKPNRKGIAVIASIEGQMTFQALPPEVQLLIGGDAEVNFEAEFDERAEKWRLLRKVRAEQT